MRVVHSICCGLDVHKRSVTGCLLTYGASGKPKKETRTFPTTTSGLLELGDWLACHHCRVVAMESTGIYWRPVYNILEEGCDEIVVANANHIKQVPGRKTDVKDAEWIAELMAHGLVRRSFVPPAEIRDLRDLTRYRSKLVKQRRDQNNRIQKLLEGGNVKLASFVSDILGTSGRDMLEALANGETNVDVLAEMARGRMRKKIPELKEALRGCLNETQRWLLAEQLAHVADLDQRIARLNEKLEELCTPFLPQIEQLKEIPGVSQRMAEIIISEIGRDMTRFGSAKHLASWACMCPGNHESAGKRRSGRRRPGSPWLRAALAEAGWAASHTKDNYLSSQFKNLQRRRGKKRACVALGHTILTIAFHLLSDPLAHFEDLGGDYFDTQHKTQLATQLLRRLGKLGFNVTIQSAG